MFDIWRRIEEKGAAAVPIVRRDAKETGRMTKKGKVARPTQDESAFYAQVRTVIVEARRYVHRAANVAMVKAYWLVGKMIVERQGGDERAQYGDQLVRGLSERLTVEFGSGFTLSNLKTMRKFYRCFPIGHTLCDQLSWSHYRLLITVENEEARRYYADECREVSACPALRRAAPCRTAPRTGGS